MGLRGQNHEPNDPVAANFLDEIVNGIPETPESDPRANRLRVAREQADPWKIVHSDKKGYGEGGYTKSFNKKTTFAI